MSDPTVVDLRDTDMDLDRHWLEDNRDRATERLSRVPERYTDATVTNTDVRNWVTRLIYSAAHAAGANGMPKAGKAKSLLILGSVGCGKTHQAYGAVRALAVSGVSCLWQFATAADVYASMRPRHGVDSEQVFERYAHAQLLVLDDLGAAKNSEWVEEVNYRLINHRYERTLPTIITSNLAPHRLRGELGERVASRLVEMCDRVVLEGPDRRRAA